MQSERKNYIYMRLSKEDGDVTEGTVEESFSIASQRICIRRYLDKNFASDTIFEEISDDGFSGTSMNRPGIAKLLEFVKQGKVSTIVVRDLSRFARNYLEAGHYLEFVFPLYAVRFISVNDNFDTRALDGDTGGLELAIRNLINEMYSRDISRKIKSVVDMKKLNGEFVYGTAPYGYKKGDKKNTIVVDENVCGTVRKIFAWAAEGVTVTQIAGRLNETGITTPSVYLASIRGKYKTRAFWTFNSVRNILRNRIYTGDTEAFKSHVVRIGSKRVKHIPPELRTVIPNTHEALISREIYFKAQQTVKSVKKPVPTPIGNAFTSLLVCGCCGNRLIKGKAKNKNWVCGSARYKKDLDCARVRVDDAKLKHTVLRAIAAQCDLMNEKIKKSYAANTVSQKKLDLQTSEIKRLRKESENIKLLKMRCYEEYVNGEADKETYIMRKQSLSARENELRAELQSAEQKAAELKNKIKVSQECIADAGRFSRFQNPTELSPALAKMLIKRVTIYPDGRIQIEWNFGSELQRYDENGNLSTSCFAG